ncbi:malto-oligosyltrehalose trehalohydrolase [Cellulomonas sp. NPDC089187]|uniref:malto-oligosyltrehalose trehalohydrolase n=1 Tax=Cellulomonas sp. NPDC089187 TaxID=3154970 RepID=UPI003425C496
MRVWAPTASTVELVLPGTDDGGGDRLPLIRTEGGWWQGAPQPHGTDYGFALDGGPLRPDPRSPWQPEGVHGPSRVFDPERFEWADGAWAGRDVRGAVVYELHVGTFTTGGTLDAAIARLGHLVDLGVEVVELLPVAPFNGRHGWGYDGVSLYGVHQPYGGPVALQRFVDAAHRAGLAVCLDVVHNHLGPSGNYLGEFGPYFTDAHQTPWGSAIDLGQPEVRRWIVDSALRWFRDFHVDALRLDAVHALIDDSPRHILTELSDAVAALDLGRPLSLIAETDLNDPVSVTPTSGGGWGMTAQWADDVHHAVHALLTGERQGYYVDFGSPQTLAQAMTRVFVHDGGHSTFRGQDWGRPVPEGVDGHRFVVFGSDHDQIGNRALGDRPSERLADAALAAEAALILLSPFTPMLFMGEEWGARTPWLFLTDHPEPELAEAVRQGRAAEFGSHGWAVMYGSTDEDFRVPDPQAIESLERSRLDWAEPELPGHRRLLDWYRQLTTLRREVSALGDGNRTATALTWDTGAELPEIGPGDVDHSPEAARARAWRSWLVLHRGDARVVINLADSAQTIPLGRTGHPQVLAAWAAGGARVTPGAQPSASGESPDPTQATVAVPPHTVVVLR